MRLFPIANLKTRKKNQYVNLSNNFDSDPDYLLWEKGEMRSRYYNNGRYSITHVKLFLDSPTWFYVLFSETEKSAMCSVDGVTFSIREKNYKCENGSLLYIDEFVEPEILKFKTGIHDFFLIDGSTIYHEFKRKNRDRIREILEQVSQHAEDMID